MLPTANSHPCNFRTARWRSVCQVRFVNFLYNLFLLAASGIKKQRGEGKTKFFAPCCVLTVESKLYLFFKLIMVHVGFLKPSPRDP